MHKRLGCRYARFAPAPAGNNLMMLPPDCLTVLADMREQGRLFLFQDSGDIHVSVWQKTLRLAAAVYFKKINLRPARQRHAGANGEQRGDLMIHVRVDRPMCKNNVWILRRDETFDFFDTRFVEFTRSVDLTGKHRLRTNDFAGRGTLGGTNLRRVFPSAQPCD